MSLLLNTQSKNAASFYNGVITSSLRFNKASSSRLTFTPDSDGGDTWTWSGWYKVSNGEGSSTVADKMFMVGDGAGIQHRNTRALGLDDDGDTNNLSTELYRDISSWYHILANSNGSASKFFVNGIEISVSGSPNIGDINNAVEHYVGSGGGNYYLDGYLADVNFVDGTALTPSSFTEFKNGVLIPIKPNVTYGGNGWRLQFLQTGTGADSSGIGADTSGNDNHWAINNLTATDVVPDCPENNFCVMNSLVRTSGTKVFSEGNLKIVQSGQAYSFFQSTFSMRTGKWYAECRVNSVSATLMIGISEQNMESYRTGDNIDPHNTAGTVWYLKTGAGYINGSSIAAATFTDSDTYTDDDVIGIALDLDSSTKNVKFFLNGTQVNSTDLSATGFIDDIGFANNIYNGATLVWNFGQDSTHAGEETATSNADANGIGAFHHSPPSGFLAVCSANLPEPTIGPNSDTVATDHFNTLLYTGNSTDDRAITGLGLKPDWVWIKKRASSNAMSHYIVDSARGTSNTSGNGTLGGLQSNGTEYEQTTTDGGFISFDNDGFTLGQAPAQGGYPNAGYERINKEDDTYVAWNWVANGGTATATISESGDNPAAVVQANPTAGFSIITYTGTGDAGTVAHGLGAVPQMIIIKNRDAADAWAVYHGRNTAAPATDYLVLNTTAGTADGAGYWADTAPTDSVFTVHDAHSVNADGEKYVAYVFAEIDGYSKFGVYTGNGIDVNGAFVYLGFRPAWIMTKVTSAANQWNIHDNKRNPDNSVNKFLLADQGVVENTGTGIKIDFMANGFRHADNGAAHNNAGVTYIYMAFAEQPFKYANAR